MFVTKYSFNNIFRKAFEHENIDSSFTTNKIKPRCIHPPKPVKLIGKSMIQTHIKQFEENNLSQKIYRRDEDLERSMKIILYCYEYSRLLLSSIDFPPLIY